MGVALLAAREEEGEGGGGSGRGRSRASSPAARGLRGRRREEAWGRRAVEREGGRGGWGKKKEGRRKVRMSDVPVPRVFDSVKRQGRHPGLVARKRRPPDLSCAKAYANGRSRSVSWRHLRASVRYIFLHESHAAQHEWATAERPPQASFWFSDVGLDIRHK